MARTICRLCGGVRRNSGERGKCDRGHQWLPVLSPEQDEALLRDAGFADVALFYAGFTFRGWVAYKA